jgi:beta-glucosidase
LGDRVKNWMTFNEPYVSAWVGHWEGRHAPGHRVRDEMLAAAHHLLLAHGWAAPVIRQNAPDAQVGIVLNLNGKYPASPSVADRAAAWQADGYLNRWYLDPLTGRGYPADMVDHFRHTMDFVQPGDLAAIAVPNDFLGVNYYSRQIIRSDAIPETENLPPTVLPNPHRTDMGWEIYPEGLYDILGRLHFEYRIPAIYLAENGAAYSDRVGSDGQVDDPLRIDYLKRHLEMVARAITAGVRVHGYFVWSLLDNFEWSYGYTKRFGLVYVDYTTQRRILKSSAHWYRRVIEANTLVD